MGTQAVSSKKRGKATKSALAVVLALALALGGTFATFYGTQTWTNEGARISSENPGGRVHDDFGNRVENATTGAVSFDKNVYAESFVDRNNEGEYLVARIRLKNYAEVNTDANNPGRVSAENKTAGTYDKPETYTTVTYDKATSSFKPNLKFGGATQPTFGVSIRGGLGSAGTSANASGQYNYVPTFNKAMEGAGATDVDVKGKYPDYSGYPYATIVGATGVVTSGTASYSNGEQFQEDHASKYTVPGYRGVTALSAWKSMQADQKDNWWVYDDTAKSDGWFYWSSPLMPNSATGLLLDGLEVTGKAGEDDLDWYYALNVEGEFITLDAPRAPSGGKYYWHNSDGVVSEVPSQDVSDLVDYVQNINNNYQARVSKAIGEATILKEVPAADASGAYRAALVDLTEGSGASAKGEEVYVLYKDEKSRKALVTTRYLSRLWGTNGVGAFDFDTTGEADWSKSQARSWCESTYYLSLPTKLQAMVPKVTITNENFAGDLSSSSSHVFFLSYSDLINRTYWGSKRDYTIPDTFLSLNEGKNKATFANDKTKTIGYWTRTTSGARSDSECFVAKDGSLHVARIADSFDFNVSDCVEIGARPAFWINY